MAQANSIGAVSANSGTGIHAGIYRHEGRAISTVMRVARSLWPRKTAENFAERTGVTIGQAERIVVARTGISYPTFIKLLHSEEGFAFLEAEMEATSSPPSWWQGFKYQTRAAQLQAEIADARRGMNNLKRKRNGLFARRT